MDKKIFKIAFLAMIFAINPVKTFAQCHIKDVIMGTVSEDENPDDERYFWTKEHAEKTAKTANAAKEEYAPHTLIVMYDKQKGKKALQKAIKWKDCKVIYNYKIINGMAIKLPEVWKIEEAMAYFKQVKGVLSVERDKVMSLQKVD